MLRALPFDFRDDPRTYDIGDQFMFGPAFLVCPIVQPVVYGSGSTPLEGIAKTRPVYLPGAGDWFDFRTGRRHHGGQTLLAEAPLDVLPLYVRAGSIVPMGPAVQYNDELPDSPLELHIYPGRDGAFLLYEDEGDSYRYEQGAFMTIPLRWREDAGRLIVGACSGHYPGMPERREFRVLLHGQQAGGCGESGAHVERSAVYDGGPITLEF
jgi:alpha-D-xyloside xylohydrolase